MKTEGGGNIDRWSDYFGDVFEALAEALAEAVKPLADVLKKIGEAVGKAMKAAGARKKERRGWPRESTIGRPATVRTSTRACIACAMRWHTAVTGD